MGKMYYEVEIVVGLSVNHAKHCFCYFYTRSGVVLLFRFAWFYEKILLFTLLQLRTLLKDMAL